MKKLTVIIIAMLTLLAMQSAAVAATSEVTWTNPNKYRDIHPGDESRKHFRDRVFNTLEKHIAKLSQRLPEGQILKIDVTNVDLAGDTHAGGISRLRIVKDIYSPRMNFSYQLVNADGSIAKEEKAELKDMGFMVGGSLKYRHQSLGYEKKMLDDWFFETFKSILVEKK